MSDTNHGIETFFALARERYRILLRKRQGLPRPWTDDPVMQSIYLCNVFREDDKVTTWFRENVRDVFKEELISLFNIALFRWFNKIEIGKVLLKNHFFESNWNEERARKSLLETFPHGPFVTGAFIIKTPNGMNKLDGVLWCATKFYGKVREYEFSRILSKKSSLEKACQILQTAPYLGRFMSYQIVCDLRHTCLLENATDKLTWTQPGPGSTRGIGRVFFNDANKFKYGSKCDESIIISLMEELLALSTNEKYWPRDWPQWELSTVQHWACEVDKICRIREGGDSKRKYAGA